MTGPSNASPILALPYPDGTDDADAPTDVQALVDRLEELLLGADDGAAGVAVGDFKDSIRTTSHGRWLLCDTERELTQAQIESELSLDAGQAAELVTMLGTGASSMYGSAATGKVKVPGFRGVMSLAVSPSHPKKGAGSTGGEETHTLSTAEIPSHSHGAGSLAAASHTHSAGSLVIPDHTHLAGSLNVASHSHGVGSLVTSAEAPVTDAVGSHNHSITGQTGGADAPDHAHSIAYDLTAIGTGALSAARLSPSGAFSQATSGRSVNHYHSLNGVVTDSNGAHGHTVASHSHTVSGSTAAAAPSVTGSTGNNNNNGVGGSTAGAGASVSGSTGATGDGDSFNVLSPYRVKGHCFLRV